MPLGPFEREILLLLAANRNPESHVAGASVLNQGPQSPRTSQDIDLFHDTEEALNAAVTADLSTLQKAGYQAPLISNQPTFKRASVSKDGQLSKIEWVFDSAFRFFPTEADPELGYRLNFWDAATNKILAGAARAVIRDYIDLLHLHEHHLSLGALAWAAAGKDDGLSPLFILEELSRLQRYARIEYESLQLTQPVDPKALKPIWIRALDEAKHLVQETLLDAPYGCLFLDKSGNPVTPTLETLPHLTPHFGTVRGCWPRIVEE